MTQTRFLTTKKVIRDIFKRNKSRTFPILFLILLSTAFGLAFLQTGTNIDITNRTVNTQGKMADLWINTSPFNFSDFTELIIDEWNATGNIEAIQTRIMLSGQTILNSGERLSVDVIALPLADHPEVNDIFTEGSYFSDFSLKMNGVYVSYPYMQEFDWEIGDTLNVEVSNMDTLSNLTLEILGGQYSPEYPFRKSDYSKLNMFQDIIIKFNIFVRIDYLQQQLFNGEDLYNQICVKLKNPDLIKETLSEIKKSDFMKNYVLFTYEFPSFMRDLNQIVVLFSLGFSGFLFFISMFAIYLTVNRFIEEEGPQIGVLKSIGYKNNYLLRLYTYYGLVFSIISGIIGLLLGYLLSIGINIMMSSLLFSWPFILSDFMKIQNPFLVFGGAISTSVLACYISARRAIKVSPQAAIRPQIEFNQASKSKIETLLELVNKRRISPPVKYYLRMTFQKPKKTLFSVIAIMSAVALVTSMVIMKNSINSGTDAILESERWDLNIEFTHFVEFNETKFTIINRIASNNIFIEPMIRDFARIQSGNDNPNYIQFSGVLTNTTLKNFEGENFFNASSVIVSPTLARTLDLSEGKSYIMTGRNNTAYSIYIQMILEEEAISGFFIPYELALKLTLGNVNTIYANNLLISSDNNTLINAIEKEFENDELVIRIVPVNSLVSSIRTFLDLFLIIVILIILAAGLIGAIIIFGIMAVSAAERKNDLVIMKAVGIKNYKIYQYAFTETTIIALIAGFLGYIMGFIMAFSLIEWMKSLLTVSTSPLKLSAGDFTFALLFAYVSLYLGQFFALRLTLKQTIAEVTKEKLFT